MAELERKDIQGMVVSAYKHLSCAAYVLLRIKNAPQARAWLSQRVTEVTASENKHASVSINLAFTYTGLKNLGLNQDTLDAFSFPFQEGMAAESRARLLGDNDENDPSLWDWGAPKNPVDALLLIFGRDETTLNAALQRQRDGFAGGGVEEAKVLHAGREPNTHEHFGFNDGIGQPVMEGTGNKQRQLDRTHHATELPVGEFLLGHPNVYKVIAPSPAVKPAADPQQLLPVIPADAAGLNAEAGMHDLGRNGSYLVFRQLAQRVAQFWQFLDKATGGPFTDDRNHEAREALGAKFVGRWMSGAPLVLSPEHDNPALATENNFTYYDKDAHGLACPIGSHVRRSNPRDSLGPDPPTALNTANRHRILRRGRSYGHQVHPKDRLVDDGAERGLHFICLNSDIERQFEFVQQTWINNPVFASLDGEVDPLVGNLKKGDALFTVQAEPLRQRVHNLSRFVVVKGGAYFFLPGLRALKYLASL
jgi:Dyp-type peroxidase family